MEKAIDKLTSVTWMTRILFVGLLAWCGACLGEAEPARSAPSREKLRDLLNDESPFLRAYAVYNVASRFPGELPNLVRFTSDTEPLVRRAAIFSLGLLRFESATEHFLRALEDPHYGVRRAAVFALGNNPSPEAAEGLRRALKDSDSTVRQLSALAMGKASNKASVRYLLPLLGDASPRVRRAAACALGALGDPSALGHLKRLYRDPKRAQPHEPLFLADKKIGETLKKELNLDYKFLHFVETLDRLSQAAGVEITVDDEVLFLLNTSAPAPENLNSIKLAMWNVPFEKALVRIVQTVGAYCYVESGRINVSSKAYQAYDTPVALEVAGAMALLGDRRALAEVREFLPDRRFRERARNILRAVTGR
jgi:hypothetical protein